MSMFSSSIKYILLTAAAALCLPSCSDELDIPNYVVAGEDMVITVPVELNEPTVQSRADLSETQLNTVQSLWVATFSSVTGQMTSKTDAESGTIGWVKVAPGTADTEPALHDVTITTKSGPSYIVAVANVENNGVLKSAPATARPLSELLENVRTWPDFLNVGVVAPSTYSAINSPQTPIVMCGAFTNAVQVEAQHTVPLAQWQQENIKSYTIPTATNGTFTLDGAIHLRRVVSQINFNIRSGNANVRVTPNSYRIINVPRYSWLYERPADDATGTTANFGDDCTEETKGNYYVSSESYSATSSFIRPDGNGGYTFNFWQAENKHKGTITATGTAEEIYKARDAQTKADDRTNTGIFTALCPDGEWTPNNMAGYVLINCTVDYTEEINVDENGAIQTPATGTDVWRTGSATYLIHLGYMGNDAADFNSYRNADYTYNVTVNGLNDIRVEAFNTAETPGVEGIVTDVTNPTLNLDCHYGAFNIQLTDAELAPWTETADGNYTGFGFMIMTYDNLNGGLKEYDEVYLLRNYASWDLVPDGIKQYIDWVEFRPTTGENVLAAYKPRTGDNADDKTFNLYDAAKGITDTQRSTTPNTGNGRWYTCFVKEYTYEAPNANETLAETASSTIYGQDPIWYSYVNADPRRFYIRVTRTVSHDGESIYSRSKYAAVQNSIQSYYGRQNIPDGTGHVRGAAMGVERVNEVYGLNMRKSIDQGTATRYAGGHPDNGRYDCWVWATDENEAGKAWSTFVDQTAPQTIPASTHVAGASIAAATYNVPKTADYSGSFSGANLFNVFDPQSSGTAQNTIEGINACMNRNRDNNGNGEIDNDELRWYVPGVNQYTRITLGANSLGTNALMDYARISSCGYKPNTGNSYDSFSFGYDGRYLFYTSGGRVFWAMEGFSVSDWRQWAYRQVTFNNGWYDYTETVNPTAASPGDPVAPWQVRCIRNLGTNLANVNETSQAVRAYTYTTTGTHHRVVPTYYELTNTRTATFSGNGDGTGELPLHLISQGNYNAVYQGGFEILSGHDLIAFNNANSTPTFATLQTYINGDPCGSLTDENNNPLDGGRWRLPNVTELAIMQNQGEFTTANRYFLSCSVLDFQDSDGAKISNAADGTNIMSGLPDRVTRSLNGHSYYVRCVRDIIE